MKMILACQCLSNKLIQHSLQICSGVCFQFSTECFSGSPETTENHLRNCKFTLCAQSLKSQVGGDGFISQCIDVGGAIVQNLVALNLSSFAGQVLSQFHCVHRISGLGVDTVDLAAQEGTHLNLLAVTSEGRQLAAAIVLTQLLLDCSSHPSTGNTTSNGIANTACQHGIVTGHKCGVVAESRDCLGGSKAICVVKIDDLLAVFDGQSTAVAQEEGSQIPAVGNVHVDLLAGCIGCC